MATLIKEIILNWAEVNTKEKINHNKQWRGELYDNGDVVTRWGRVGNDLQSKTFSGAGEGFLLKKEAEKLAKGYTAPPLATGISGSAGKVVAVNNLHEIAKAQLLKSSNNPVLDRLIDRLVKSNVHKITSTTNITLNDSTGLFQTPMGIITPEGIADARLVLADIFPLVKDEKYNSTLEGLISKFLRLIPQDIGMRFDVRKILPDVSAVQKQSDILDSLEASYQAISSSTPKKSTGTNAPVEQVFKVDLDLETGSDAGRLEQWYESSKKKMHGYDKVKIINIYRVKIHSMNDTFLNSDTNKKEIFHGTSMANVLSILKSGLKISPPATAAIAGKMFGNGIYGAIHSTKSLGYCFNKWGQGGVGDAGFLFVADFALGRCYSTTAYGCNKPSGYDSVWAKSSPGGLHHDELIVYSENRVNPKFILECK